MIRYRLTPSTAPKVKGIVFVVSEDYTWENSHFRPPKNGALEDDFPFQLGDF